MYDCVYFADCWTALEHGITPSVRSRTQERACVRSLRRGRENLRGRIGMTQIRLCSRKLLQRLPKIHLVRHRKREALICGTFWIVALLEVFVDVE